MSKLHLQREAGPPGPFNKITSSQKTESDLQITKMIQTQKHILLVKSVMQSSPHNKALQYCRV